MVEEPIDWVNMDGSEFYGMLTTESDAFLLADRLGLLDHEIVCDCGATMKRQIDAHKTHGMRFVCSKSRSLCHKTKSILHGSWFANSRLTIRQGFFAICSYAADLDYNQFSFFAGMKSSKTIVDWRMYFRDICASVVDSLSGQKIGGPGFTVEVDESLIFKRKSHAGRLLANQSSGVWIFGGICRENGEAFLAQVPNRNTETLLRCIYERILPGTRIISDCWRAYSALVHTNYEHATVNHTYNFLNPEDPTVNTQRVERMWRTLKQIIPKASNSETRWTYLAEFIFKQRTGWYTLPIGSRIELILKHLRAIDFNS